jgi:hypothetical protein
MIPLLFVITWPGPELSMAELSMARHFGPEMASEQGGGIGEGSKIEEFGLRSGVDPGLLFKLSVS